MRSSSNALLRNFCICNGARRPMIFPALIPIHRWPSDSPWLRKFIPPDPCSWYSALRCCTSTTSSEVDKLYKTITDTDIRNGRLDLDKALDEIRPKLTTPIVLETLGRLHSEEKLALRFFIWAGKQEHYSHEHKAYNEMIDALSCTKFKLRQFRIVCRLLDYMKRNGRNSVPSDVLLKILNDYAEKHLTSLRKIPRKNIFKVRVEPAIKAFNLLMDALCKCSLVEYADAMVQRMNKLVEPDGDTFNTLFFGWCRVRNPDRAIGVLERMIRLGHRPDNFCYNTAIETFCESQMILEAEKIFGFMKTEGSSMTSPTAKTYSVMIRAYVKNDMIGDCERLVKEMAETGYLPDVSTYKEVVTQMCVSGKMELAYRFVEEMGMKGYPPDIVTFNCFLKVLCENGKMDEALSLFARMTDVGCSPSVQSYNILVSGFFRAGDVAGAVQTWSETEKTGCGRDAETYCAMINGMFGCGRTDDARALLDEVVSREIKLSYPSFDSFLMKLSDIGDLRSIHSLSDHMKKFYSVFMSKRFVAGERKKRDGFRRGRKPMYA